MYDIVKPTKSAATKEAYRSDFKMFRQWCSAVDLRALPAAPNTVALYIVALSKIGRRMSTIRRAVVSISQAHALQNQKNPINSMVKEILKGLCRIKGTATKKKLPIDLIQLNRMIAHIPRDYIGDRNRTILLVGWTGALRRSEICSINMEDIQPSSEGMTVTISMSKTDQEGQGRLIGLPFIDKCPKLCAARSLRDWINTCGYDSGPVFRGIGKSGTSSRSTALHPKMISIIIKNVCARAGYDSSQYSGHSLRAGLATELAKHGVDERKIMDITGHKSLKILREYIHSGGIFYEHPVLGLFQGGQFGLI